MQIWGAVLLLIGVWLHVLQPWWRTMPEGPAGRGTGVMTSVVPLMSREGGGVLIAERLVKCLVHGDRDIA